jgi:hypothetical protein
VRRVVVENDLAGRDHASVWLIPKIDGQWEEPRDLTEEDETDFCRNFAGENITEMVLVIGKAAAGEGRS